MKAKFSKLINPIVVATLTLSVSCSSQDKKSEDETAGQTPNIVSPGGGVATKDLTVPDASGINLKNLGKTKGGALLTSGENVEDETCKMPEDMGVFGVSLGSACHAMNLLDSTLYGKNGDQNQDGVVDCKDYKQNEDDQGILLALLCEPSLQAQSQVTTVKFEEDDEAIAISFEDYGGLKEIAAVGSWTAIGPAEGRFPANIRLWSSEAGDGLQGVIALNLENGRKGNIYYDLAKIGEGLKAEVEFSSHQSTSGCMENPSKETCHYQRVMLKGVENKENDLESFPGLHVSVMANDKLNPDFIVIVGKMQLSEKIANEWFAPKNGKDDEFAEKFLGTREIYFRTVQKGNQLWGSFDFKDENNNSIIANIDVDDSNTIDFGKLLRDGTSDQSYSGFCVNLGGGDFVPCQDIDYTKYDALWIADEDLEVVPVDYEIPVDFSGVPTVNGFQTK